MEPARATKILFLYDRISNEIRAHLSQYWSSAQQKYISIDSGDDTEAIENEISYLYDLQEQLDPEEEGSITQHIEYEYQIAYLERELKRISERTNDEARKKA